MSRYTSELAPNSVSTMLASALGNALRTRTDVIVSYLFGSAATGRLHAESDIDVGVLFVDSPTPAERLQRRLELMALLEPLAVFPVQVISLDDASPFLAYTVVCDGIVLLERDRMVRVEFEVRAMKAYFDVRPMLERQYRAMGARLEGGRFGQGRHHQSALDAARELHRRIAVSPEH